MKLYILRHGHSPSMIDSKVADDDARPLSPRGRRDAQKSAETLASRAGAPRRILHSPLLRAVETAAIAAETLKPADGRGVYAPLSNIISAAELLAALREPLAAEEELLIVGHQPQLGELAALLCGHVLELRPAGLIAFDIPKQDGPPALLWTFQP